VLVRKADGRKVSFQSIIPNTLLAHRIHSCKVAFVDTELVPARDARVGDLVQNTTEATLIHQITELFIRCGVEQNNIGIISLYRQQIKLLSNLLQDRPEVEILTVDRSQGRDKDCVIVSMVRSNEDGRVRTYKSRKSELKF
jgi:DNA replication ATP-dependent helicase Dna2